MHINIILIYITRVGIYVLIQLYIVYRILYSNFTYKYHQLYTLFETSIEVFNDEISEYDN